MLFTTHFPPCRLHVLRSISSMPVSLKGPTTHYQHSHPPIFLLLQSTICPLTLHKLHQSPITPATALLPPFTLHTQHQPHNTPSPNSLQHQPPSAPAATDSSATLVRARGDLVSDLATPCERNRPRIGDGDSDSEFGSPESDS